MEAKLLAETSDIHAKNAENFPQSCKISPDGLCILTSTSEDAKIRLYNIPSPSSKDAETIEVQSMSSALVCQGRDVVRSMDWYPTMDSSTPATCCFVASCRGQPAHLWDAYTGKIRATYSPYNHMDELESPTVVRFSNDGQQLVAAGMRTDRVLHVFDTSRPGRETSTLLRLGKTRRSSDGQKGIVSCVAFGDGDETSAMIVGTVAPASIYLYDMRLGTLPAQTILQGQSLVGHGVNHAKKRRLAKVDNDNANDENWLGTAKTGWYHKKCRGGVMQLETKGNYLYSVARRSDVVLKWDLRMLQGLGSFETDTQTNQRIGFHLNEDGARLFTASRDGTVRQYDTTSGNVLGELVVKTRANCCPNVVNDVSLFDSSKRSILAMSTGSRWFPSEEDFELDSGVPAKVTSGSLQVYDMAVTQAT